VLVHLVDLSDARDPLAAFDAINVELAAFDGALAAKPQLVVATKLDVTEARARYDAATAAFAGRGIALLGVSAATGAGITALMSRVAAAVRDARGASEGTEPTTAALANEARP